MIRAFAFDLDETLVDCEDQHRRATRAMLEALGFEPDALRDAFHAVDAPAGTSAPRFAADTTGARTRDLVESYRSTLGAAASVDEMLSLRHSAFLTALDDAPAIPLPGARECLEACAARGPVALVTSGHREDALETLRSAALLPYFGTIVTGEDVHEPKPSPEPYLVAASRLRVAPAELLVFEDSRRGVAAARAAGCHVVAVPNARSTRREQVADADVVLSSLREALPLDALLSSPPLSTKDR